MRLQKYLVLIFFSSISFLMAQGEPEVWVEVASLPSSASKRAESGSFTINGKGYIFGGTAAYPNWLSDCWEYDPVNDSWRQMASIPLIGPREPAFLQLGIKDMQLVDFTVLVQILLFQKMYLNLIQLPIHGLKRLILLEMPEETL